MKKLLTTVLAAAALTLAAPAQADHHEGAQQGAKQPGAQQGANPAAQPAAKGQGSAQTKARGASGQAGMIPATTKSPEARKAFEEAIVYQVNARGEDARKAFERALRADPGFALARASLATLQPPQEGMANMQKARQAAAGLPQAERLLIAVLDAEMKGDAAEARKQADALVKAAPKDWRAYAVQGQAAMGRDDWKQVKASAKKASELAPEQGSPYNLMGYAYLNEGDTQSAIRAFQEYARLAPDQPNPQDSLGEAYLTANRLPEADQAFQRAAQIEPSFYVAYLGSAQARQLQGKKSEARKAFEQALQKAPDARAKGQVLEWLTLHQYAFGDVEGARKTAARMAREGGADNPMAAIQSDLLLARIDAMEGQYQQAIQRTRKAEERAGSAGLPEPMQDQVETMASMVRAYAHRHLEQADEAKKDAQAVRTIARKFPGQREMRSAQAFTDGEAAWAEGDAARAASDYAKCDPLFSWCRYQQAEALKAAGKDEQAEQAADTLASRPMRDAELVVVLAKMDRLPKTVSMGQ